MMEYIDPVIGFVEVPEASNCSFREFNDSLLRTFADSMAIPKDMFFREQKRSAQYHEEIKIAYVREFEFYGQIAETLRKWIEPFHIATLYQFGESRKSLWARYPHYTKAQIRKIISKRKHYVSMRGKLLLN